MWRVELLGKVAVGSLAHSVRGGRSLRRDPLQRELVHLIGALASCGFSKEAQARFRYQVRCAFLKSFIVIPGEQRVRLAHALMLAAPMIGSGICKRAMPMVNDWGRTGRAGAAL